MKLFNKESTGVWIDEILTEDKRKEDAIFEEYLKRIKYTLRCPNELLGEEK